MDGPGQVEKNSTWTASMRWTTAASGLRCVPKADGGRQQIWQRTLYVLTCCPYPWLGLMSWASFWADALGTHGRCQNVSFAGGFLLPGRNRRALCCDARQCSWVGGEETRQCQWRQSAAQRGKYPGATSRAHLVRLCYADRQSVKGRVPL